MLSGGLGMVSKESASDGSGAMPDVEPRGCVVPASAGRTVGEVRGLLGRLAERYGTTVAGVLSAVQQDITREQEAAQRRLAVLCHAQLVPDDHTLGQVMGYESHLARLFHRDLHELERLQAARNAQHVAEQLVMDIDLAGLPDGSPPLCRG